MWRDLYSGCVCFFYSFFYYLEDIGILNKDDERDKFALHFVFLPLIQQQLDTFREGWAHHSLRTMRSRTPLQLWVMGKVYASEPECDEIRGMSDHEVFYFCEANFLNQCIVFKIVDVWDRLGGSITNCL